MACPQGRPELLLWYGQKPLSALLVAPASRHFGKLLVRHKGGVVAYGAQPLDQSAHVYIHDESRLHFPTPVSKWYDFWTDHGTIAQESA